MDIFNRYEIITNTRDSTFSRLHFRQDSGCLNHNFSSPMPWLKTHSYKTELHCGSCGIPKSHQFDSTTTINYKKIRSDAFQQPIRANSVNPIILKILIQIFFCEPNVGIFRKDIKTRYTKGRRLGYPSCILL